MSSPPQPPHPDRQLYPMVLSMKGRSCRRLHGSNALRLHCMRCFCYPEFLLGDKISNPDAATIMLLWWSKTTIFTFII